MDENTLAKILEDLAAQDAALAKQEQTADVARQRNDLLRSIQEFLENVRDDALIQDAA